MKEEHISIGVIGLGYVGLPLSRLLALKYSVVGFDTNSERVASINQLQDNTLELSAEEIAQVLKQENSTQKGLFITSQAEYLQDCNYFIITVPTPVNSQNKPDTSLLEKASATVGKFLKKGDVVIYESTVYPGCTEQVCVPVLESISGLVFNTDFFVGYSPERINPGDKTHRVENIQKITAGSTFATTQKVDALYRSIIKAGTFPVSSIAVAEAAKIIENTQRDVNIAFMNEVAKICHLVGVSTQEVLKAASTKWNFLPFKPGLVGGHCTGVDPYYLIEKAEQMGYFPSLIKAARSTNESMGTFVAQEVIGLLKQNSIAPRDARVLVMGITFKENCPDARNSKVVDIVNYLQDIVQQVVVYDPYAIAAEVEKEHHLRITSTLEHKQYQAIIVAVAHSAFMHINIEQLKAPKAVVYDVKGILAQADSVL